MYERVKASPSPRGADIENILNHRLWDRALSVFVLTPLPEILMQAHGYTAQAD